VSDAPQLTLCCAVNTPPARVAAAFAPLAALEAEIVLAVDDRVDPGWIEGYREIAEVRSVIELSDDQKQRLAAALEAKTGKRVELKVIIDPTLLGGLVAQVGDTVIDGSVKSRLQQLKTAF